MKICSYYNYRKELAVYYLDDWTRSHVLSKYNLEKYLLLNIDTLLYQIESKDWLMEEWDWIQKNANFTLNHSHLLTI